MAAKKRFTILIVFLIFASASFWLVSRYPALDSKAALSGMEAFEDPLTNEAHFHVSRKADFLSRVIVTTLNWYQTNWRGMVFGLVIAAGFFTLLKYTPRQPSDKRFRNSFMGMFVGTPLGVCVNCVAPIAKGLYEAGSKMETALAVMFSSPTLNIIVLTMLFSIFPFYMALAKLLATFVLILLIVPLISEKKINTQENSVCEIGISCDISNESWPEALKKATEDYLKGLQYIFIRTVPLMLLAGLLGAVASHAWSFDKLIGVPIDLINLSLISFMGTLMPLPIAFDLMLAQALMMSGLAPAFVTTMLFTLGTFSIYSAMIVARTFSTFLAVKLFLIVFAIGVSLGYISNWFVEYRHIQWLQQYDRVIKKKPVEKKNSQATQFFLIPTPNHAAPIIQKQGNITLRASTHEPRNKNEKKLFTVQLGNKMGITYSNTLTPSGFIDPLFFGRGIASGDFNQDGWTDFVIATGNGFELYQNLYGKKFKKVFYNIAQLKDKQAINIALVDLNNDGWLDIFLTTFNEGNFVVLNPIPFEGEITVRKVPNGNSLLTSASAFSDIDQDGFLDIINGNYYLGILTRKPIKQATDQLVFNRNLEFDIHEIEGIPGQTHSTLLSDLNLDGHPDLVIGNDYRVSDAYYHGKSKGVFKKILHQDNIIPLTTQNTMSIDTGDFNNDLIPDIYLANIGMSRGLDVVSNIFGDTMKNVGLDFCESGKSVLNKNSCYQFVKLATLLNPERQDLSEKCSSLRDLEKIQECMVMRMVLVATTRKEKKLCNKISTPFMLNNLVCNKYFEAKHLKLSTDEEIPMQTQFNLLLSGQPDRTFNDLSKQTQISTAEWSWNARFGDLDNDQWQDLYVVNGVPITQEFAANSFFHNEKGQRFKSAEREYGLDDYDHSSSYTYLDFDRDGDLDIIANTLYGPFKVYTNHESKNNSVTFKIRDKMGNRFCLGCKIILRYGLDGEKQQFREIKTGGGFHSYDAPLAHFGLGEFKNINSIYITWSTGESTRFEGDFPVNREYIVQREKSHDP
tara:strand:+ start:703 stop:3765 length:3063 start_codon:yes stop_codon:yes gene_type:complete